MRAPPEPKPANTSISNFETLGVSLLIVGLTAGRSRFDRIYEASNRFGGRERTPLEPRKLAYVNITASGIANEENNLSVAQFHQEILLTEI